MKKVILLLLAMSVMFGCAYSEGERNGQVVKLSKKGWVNKTWEGELILGNVGMATGGNVWNFSVPNAEMAKQVQEASRGGRIVSLQYKQIAPRWATLTSTPYHVIGVK